LLLDREIPLLRTLFYLFNYLEPGETLISCFKLETHVGSLDL
jgi:hypothetical protein